MPTDAAIMRNAHAGKSLGRFGLFYGGKSLQLA